MVETVKTQAALLAQMADGGNNTAEEVRDNIVSAWSPGWVRYLDHRLPNETAHADDDFFTTDTSADYTEITVSGTADWVLDPNLNLLSVSYNNQTASDAAASLKALTSVSAPITIETAARWRPSGAISTSEFSMFGLVLSDGVLASSNSIVLNVFWNNVDPPGIFLREGTLTSLGGTQSQSIYANTTYVKHPYFGHLYCRLIWIDTTTVACAVSIDGVTWVDNGVADLTVASFTPTHAGFWVSTWGGNDLSQNTFEYLRRNNADQSV